MPGPAPLCHSFNQFRKLTGRQRELLVAGEDCYRLERAGELSAASDFDLINHGVVVLQVVKLCFVPQFDIVLHASSPDLKHLLSVLKLTLIQLRFVVDHQKLALDPVADLEELF